MNKVKTLAVFNAISFALHLAVVYLTQYRMINPATVSEISDQYPSQFTPAGITFAIWGVIYTVLAVFCLYHIIMAYKHDKNHPANNDTDKIGGLFIFNSLATAAWLWAWTNNQLLVSLLLIVIQLLTLIAIHLRLNIVNRDREAGSLICTQFPLSIYFGWISLATIANISIYLVSIKWNGGGLNPDIWTIIVIVVAIILALLMIWLRKNVWFGLVIVWGLWGIYLKWENVTTDNTHPVILTCWIGMGIILLVCIIQAVLNFLYRRKTIRFPEAKTSLK